MSYSFVVAGGVKKDGFQAVIERPELYQVSINGKRIDPVRGKWWLDKVFGVFDIGRFVVEGENRILLKSSPFTIHTEIQPVFILGDFALESRDKGFGIISAAPMEMGSWAEQGMPFYGDRIEYTKKYQLTAEELKNQRAFVRLGKWTGVVGEVKVNGKKAGLIGFEPFELDVREHLKPGTNEVSVVVCGSLKNTLGPHHNDPLLGRAWPGAFQQGAKDGRPAGSRYHAVGYGLHDDFVLELQ